MSEAILRKDWVSQVELAFEKLKAASTAERQEWFEIIREDHGRDAEAELKAKLTAHDQAMQPKPRLTWRRHLNGAKATATGDAIKVTPLRDVVDVATPTPEPAPKTEPEPEPSKLMLPAVRFSTETPKPNDAPAVLSQVAPYDSAKEYVRRNSFRDGLLAAFFWQGEFWEWNGRHYEALPAEVIRDRVYAFLDGSQKLARDEVARFRPTPKNVNEVIDALKAGLTPVSKGWHPPVWIDTGQSAADVLVFRNGLVNVVTGERMPLTPKLWVHSGVDYDYDPKAKCPRWERFLEEDFPGDRASQDCIEEQLGYGMTEETKFERAGMWIGEKRSGKGTIAFIQRKLIGDGAYVGLSFTSWLSNENSASCMIGKRVGVFPDVRLKPGKAYGASYDAGGINFPSIEMLLKITGEDTMTLGRKWIGPWHGQLKLKLILISNDILNFNDAILPTRFIKINFTQSFAEREDADLREKLKAEISGIAIRCMAAYRRLLARGRFSQPQSSIELERKVQAESDPYTAFISHYFVVEPEGMVNCALVKLKFEEWCHQRRRADLLCSTSTASQLSQRLKKVASLRTFKPHGGQRQYIGLRMKTKEERETA